jgi:hypothetical protein
MEKLYKGYGCAEAVEKYLGSRLSYSFMANRQQKKGNPNTNRRRQEKTLPSPSKCRRWQRRNADGRQQRRECR